MYVQYLETWSIIIRLIDIETVYWEKPIFALTKCIYCKFQECYGMIF